MLTNRSFLRGLGSGFIIGAVLLQLMIMVTEAREQTQEPVQEPETAVQIEWTPQLVREKAAELGMQVYEKDVKVYDQKALDEAVRKAAETAKAEAAAPARQLTVYIPDGLRASQVLETLVKSGVVKDRKAFEQALRDQEATSKIRSGAFTFLEGESHEDIIAKLTRVPNQ